MAKKIAGVLAVAHTPFDPSDQIDDGALRQQVDWAYDVGANGIGTGMVSETLRLAPRERRHLVEQLVQASAGRGIVFASVGAESTGQAVEYARHATEVGCNALMAIPPVTTAISEVELTDYFTTIAEASPLPVIIQDASSYVGQTIPLSRVLDIARPFRPRQSAIQARSGTRWTSFVYAA